MRMYFSTLYHINLKTIAANITPYTASNSDSNYNSNSNNHVNNKSNKKSNVDSTIFLESVLTFVSNGQNCTRV